MIFHAIRVRIFSGTSTVSISVPFKIKCKCTKNTFRPWRVKAVITRISGFKNAAFLRAVFLDGYLLEYDFIPITADENLCIWDSPTV